VPVETAAAVTTKLLVGPFLLLEQRHDFDAALHLS
jgi:hypothetical protein